MLVRPRNPFHKTSILEVLGLDFGQFGPISEVLGLDFGLIGPTVEGLDLETFGNRPIRIYMDWYRFRRI